MPNIEIKFPLNNTGTSQHYKFDLKQVPAESLSDEELDEQVENVIAFIFYVLTGRFAERLELKLKELDADLNKQVDFLNIFEARFKS